VPDREVSSARAAAGGAGAASWLVMPDSSSFFTVNEVTQHGVSGTSRRDQDPIKILQTACSIPMLILWCRPHAQLLDTAEMRTAARLASFG
jgi:hypothetical protein